MKLGIKNGQLWQGDCLELMKDIPSGSIDMILCDLPYGITQNKWDCIIPLEPLWSEYWRVVKPNTAIVLTAAQPFTSALIMSQVDHFKYDWVWQKPKGTGFLNAKKMPMKDKEDIVVFYKKQSIYNPQFGQGKPYDGNKRVKNFKNSENYGRYKSVQEDNDGKRYPKQILNFPVVERGTIHPTQKPVALFEYLIKTYTNPGDIVLDNCIGSGTTAVAAENTGRRWDRY